MHAAPSLDLEIVRHILACLEAIDRAEMTVQRHPGDRDVARLARDAVEYRLVAIGKAVRSLSLEIREDHPAVPWSDVERMSDLLGSLPDGLDPQTLADTIGSPLRRLRSACRSILAESVRVGEDEP